MKTCPHCQSHRVTASWSCDECGQAAPVVNGVPILAPAVAEWTGEDAQYHYQELATAESTHFWFVNRAELIAWGIRRYFPKASSFLDVGCGTGGVELALRRLLPDLPIVAGDSQLSGLQLAKARMPEQPFVQFDIRSLPYEQEFGVVGAFDVLEHLDDDEAVLGEMFRATTPGGGLIVTVPQHQWLWSAVDDFSQHRRRYSRGELVSKIERAGFRVLRTTSFMTFVLPLLAATRLRKRQLAELNPVAELEIGAVTNAALTGLCRLEAACTRAGVLAGRRVVAGHRPTAVIQMPGDRMSDAPSLPAESGIWSRGDLWRALAIGMTVAVMATGATRAFSDSGFPASFYQDQFGPAVLFACGHGFQNPPEPQNGHLDDPETMSLGFERLNEFLLQRRSDFDCADLPATFQGTPPDTFQVVHRYLMLSAAFVWRASGVSWPALAVLAGMLAGMTGALTYLFFRAGMGWLLALLLTMVCALSPLQLAFLPHLRDYAKAPFFVLMLCAIAWIVLVKSPRGRMIAGSAGIGAVLGFGFGIRSDVIGYLAMIVIAIMVFRPGFDWPDLLTRVMAASAATATFAVVALPILRAYQTSDNLAHVAILGMADPSRELLKIRGPVYSFGYLYDDGYPATAIAAYADRSVELAKPVMLGTREYALWGNEYYQRLMAIFPADVLIRAWAAVAEVFELPLGQVNIARPSWIGPFVGAVFDWRANVLAWLGVLSPLATGAIVAISVGVYSLRLAGAMLFFGLIVTGMTALQFQGRHVFHLELLALFLYGCLFAGLWRVVRFRAVMPPGGVKSAARRAALVAVTLALGMVAPISAARSYQTGAATGLLSSYELAAKELLPVSPSPTADPDVVLLGVTLQVSSSPEHWVDTNMLSVTVGGEACDTDVVPITFRYRAVDPYTDLSRQTKVPVSAGSSTTNIVFPVFTLGARSAVADELSFAGIEVLTSQQSCIVAVSRFRHPSAFPLLLEATLRPGWRTRRLYETLVDYESPDLDEGYEIYSAPDTFRPGRHALSQIEKVTSATTYRSKQVRRVDPEGIEVSGKADRPSAYLVSWPYAPRERGSAFVVEGEVFDGGVMIGLQQDERWTRLVNVNRPGKFRAIVRVDVAGTYSAVISNLLVKSLNNHSIITRYGWLPPAP